MSWREDPCYGHTSDDRTTLWGMGDAEDVVHTVFSSGPRMQVRDESVVSVE